MSASGAGGFRPTATRAALARRAQLLAASRAFFAARGVLEVETPVLARGAATDPHIDSLATRIAGLPGEFHLCTSPEFAMKRLLAAGYGDIYQFARVFRDGEQGRWHNPEFTLLEWYRLGFDDHALMDEVEALLAQLLAPERTLARAERLSYDAALERHTGIADGARASTAVLAAAAAARGLVSAGLEHDALLDLLMGVAVGPQLGHERPCFVCDYPASQAALARLKPGSPPRAARFELYIDGVELANGFQELADPREQRRRFEADLAARRARAQREPPLDEHLIAALEAGLPDCAGVALGFDRLVAVALGARSLAEVMAFPIGNA